jgi:hypothetical protein
MKTCLMRYHEMLANTRGMQRLTPLLASPDIAATCATVREVDLVVEDMLEILECVM